MAADVTARPVLFFDGVCNLCNGFVQFIIRHDKRRQLLFASLQSARGQAAARQLQQQSREADSIILYSRGRYYTKSGAALRTAKLMGGVWQLLIIGWIIPAFLRNALYDWVARNRYRWFGKKDSCMIPTPALKGRFIDDE